MVFHHNQKQVQYPNIKINNIEINRVSQFIFLGITEPGTLLVSSKVHTHSFIGFKIYIKNKVIDSYSYICNKVVCESCRRLT